MKLVISPRHCAVASLLRLGMKYDFTTIRIEVLRALRTVYPETYESMMAEYVRDSPGLRTEMLFYDEPKLPFALYGKRFQLLALLLQAVDFDCEDVRDSEDETSSRALGAASIIIPTLSFLSTSPRVHSILPAIAGFASPYLSAGEVSLLLQRAAAFQQECADELSCSALLHNIIDGFTCGQGCDRGFSRECLRHHELHDHSTQFNTFEDRFEGPGLDRFPPNEVCERCIGHIRRNLHNTLNDLWDELPRRFVDSDCSWDDLRLRWENL